MAKWSARQVEPGGAHLAREVEAPLGRDRAAVAEVLAQVLPPTKVGGPGTRPPPRSRGCGARLWGRPGGTRWGSGRRGPARSTQESTIAPSIHVGRSICAPRSRPRLVRRLTASRQPMHPSWQNRGTAARGGEKIGRKRHRQRSMHANPGSGNRLGHSMLGWSFAENSCGRGGGGPNSRPERRVAFRSSRKSVRSSRYDSSWIVNQSRQFPTLLRLSEHAPLAAKIDAKFASKDFREML